MVSQDKLLFEAWQRFCSKFPYVEFYNGSILDLKVNAVVSPANSFGFMDGGIDRIYSTRFRGIQHRLQDLIVDEHDGELLVGTAALVPTDDPDIPFLISAPTMRVPMVLTQTVNPYLAAKAALRLAFRHHLESIAFPGLGTGVGRVPPEVCARQVASAIDDVLEANFKFPITWFEAQNRHQLLYSDRFRDLQL